jgi:hypothetical protein
MPFLCPTCGTEHDDLPDVEFARPDAFLDLPPDQRLRRTSLTPDLCVIDRTSHFVRAVVEVPVPEDGIVFGFCVWARVSPDDFTVYQNHLESEELWSFPGQLANAIAFYTDKTLDLGVALSVRQGTLRPHVKIEEPSQLASDQLRGISLERAWEIVHFFERG